MNKYSKAYFILAAAFVLLFIGNLVYGAVNIPAGQVLGEWFRERVLGYDCT